MAANTSLSTWWITCDCQRKKECPKCNNTGKIHPDRCPIHYYTSEIQTLRLLYDSYTHKNILPFSGSLIEQPKKIFNVFEAIDRCLSERNSLTVEQRDETMDIVARINKGKRNG